MAKLYADENFPQPVLEILRQSGHDIVTMLEDGKANQRIPDQDVLKLATAAGRIVLTFNRKDFIKLHHTDTSHAGIIVCTVDPDFTGLAYRIDAILQAEADLSGQLKRVNRPNP